MSPSMDRGWGRTVLTGAVGGVVSGVLILGTGFRLAMRVVAILDPYRHPEFTIEGTLFILIGLGVIIGGTLGVVGVVANRLIRQTMVSGLLPAVGVMVLVMASDDLRAELFRLGWGPWLNIPMFGAVALLYGTGSIRFAEWMQQRDTRGSLTRHAVNGDASMIPETEGSPQ